MDRMFRIQLSDWSKQTRCCQRLNVARLFLWNELNFLDQKTAKGPFGLWVKQSPAHLSTTQGEGFTLSLFLDERQTLSWEYQFLVFGLTRPEIEPESTVLVADILFILLLFIMMWRQLRQVADVLQAYTWSQTKNEHYIIIRYSKTAIFVN